MATEVFQTKEWNDLVFEGKNKEYGAYVLRMEHERNMAAGLVTAFGLLGLLLVLGVVLSKYTGTAIVPDVPPVIIDIKDLNFEKIIEPIFEEKPLIESKEVKTEKLTNNLQIVNDKKADNFADNETLNKSVVSTSTNDKGAESVGTEPVSGNGTGEPSLVESAPPKPEIFPMGATEIAPQFPGGEVALNKFLANHIKYTQEAKEIGKQGNVFLTFVIDENGRPVNITVARGLCCGLNEAAIKAIEEMPNWSPGIMGNKAVKVMYALKVAFKLN